MNNRLGSCASAEWPREQLERVGKCPVCDCAARVVAHTGMRDVTFGSAPGVWTMYVCSACGAGYLDPRPTPSSIGLAYRTYYTHCSIAEGPTADLYGRVRQALLNGYLNWRFGYHLKPTLMVGALIVPLFPAACSGLESQWRHLRRPQNGARLLDIGCGDGNFLRLVKDAGWHATGLELDPEAVRTAKQSGVDVIHGDVHSARLPAESFDAVTLNSVIEHLHDPIDVLTEIHRILRPGGSLWIVTPNFGGAGYRRFGEFWRGLEAPRHLIVFTASALISALQRAGFEQVKFKRPAFVSSWYYQASVAIAAGRDPSAVPLPALDVELAREARRTDWMARLDPKRSESLAVLAWKSRTPSDG